MIIMQNGDITLEKDNYTGEYAVFKRVIYPSGTTAFWQQISKWYIYRRYAERVYNGK